MHASLPEHIPGYGHSLTHISISLFMSPSGLNRWFLTAISDIALTLTPLSLRYSRALHAMDANLSLRFISSAPIFNGLCCLLLLIPLAVCGFFRETQLPLVNGSKLFEFGKSQARKRFYQDAAALIQSGLRKV